MRVVRPVEGPGDRVLGERMLGRERIRRAAGLVDRVRPASRSMPTRRVPCVPWCVLLSERVDVKCAADSSRPIARGLKSGIPARSRTEPPSFGRSGPQSGGTGTWSPRQESNLGNRLRRPVLGIHRDEEEMRCPRRELNPRCRFERPLAWAASRRGRERAPHPRTRTWIGSLRRRVPFPLGEWGMESREGIKPSRAVDPHARGDRDNQRSPR